MKVVTLPVTVRDKHNQIVKGLTKADFTLTEDGHPQTIKYFNVDTNLALTLGLLVDSSQSQRTVLDQEKTASKSFLDQMLTVDKDKAFVIHFDSQVELLQDLTASRDKLKAAVDLIEESPPQMSDASDTSGGGGRHRGSGTQLYDSIYLASGEVMKKQQGRKALIILTDGVDRGSKETLNTSIEAAQRADTEVYTIYFKGERGGGGGNDNASNGNPGMGRHGGMGGGYPGGGGGYPGGGGGYPGGGGGYPRGGGGQRPTESHVDGKKILEQISGETGGRFFEVTKKETVDQIYATIEEELRSQYVLGYTPDKTNSGAGYHKLALTTDKKDVTLQTRAGYYADR